MDEGKKQITLPEELQIKIMEFFLKTSIPRKKQEKLEQEKAEQVENLSSK